MECLANFLESYREGVVFGKQLRDDQNFTYVPAPITAAAPESVNLLTGASPRGTAVQLRATAMIRMNRNVKEVKTVIVICASFKGTG